MNADTTTRRLALRGDLLDFSAAPARDTAESPALRWRPDHWLLIEDGRIAGVQAAAPAAPDAPDPSWQRIDHAGRLILPGFIDTHVHSAQLDVIGSWGAQLLDWLDTYTFPCEQGFADPEQARRGSSAFVDALLAHGTTSAVVFPTVHKVSVDALFEAAAAHGMRLIAGKVLMDRHAPQALRDDVDSAERDCEELIARWHGQQRLCYAVTPRFAPSSSDAQLAMAGRLLARHAGLYMQTHVAENRAEVRWAAELFPAARSYLDVYERHGLLTERAVRAHAVWIDAADRALLHQRGAAIAHCPTSNLFLGSGLFGWAAAEDAGVAIGLASDVGGGTSLSMIRTMAAAYQVQALAGTKLSAWALLHAATRGAATALRLQHEIGSFDLGAAADLCVWDWAVGAVAQRRQRIATKLHERAFAWITLADERYLVQTYVAGRLRYERDAAPAAG
jgi:guanine deaminase